jgi:hypothetical protein
MFCGELMRMNKILLVLLLSLSALGLPRVACAGLTDGLVAYWKFDEGAGTTAADASTNVFPTGVAHPATLHGCFWTNGLIGKALSFATTNDYASLGSSQASDINSIGVLTYAAWVNTRTSSGYICDCRRPFGFYGTQLRFTGPVCQPRPSQKLSQQRRSFQPMGPCGGHLGREDECFGRPFICQRR